MLKPWQKYGLPEPKSEASKGPLSLADYEIYSGLEVPSGPFFVRLDGWCFHSLTKRLKLKQPFDKKFASWMTATAKQFFTLFNPKLAYIFSDEINLLFLKRTSFARIEKIDSIFAGIASSIFSKLCGRPAIFDCRVIPIPKSKIVSYLLWRQAECFRNHNNAWAYWVLRKSGLSPRQAAKKLTGLKTAKLKEICAKMVNLNRTPVWQRYGILIYWTKYRKIGWNPIEKKKVFAERRKPVISQQKLSKQFITKII
jgi:tRNA(His) 5'-end guanylyltransferase